MNNQYKPVIGLEVHVELKTKSKMFCSCSADYFGHKPNTHCCPVCLGLPGALPVPNKTAIDWCLMIGQALNCEINLMSKFDRKNYFYPDLPKGYQISQYDEPFAINGSLKIKNQPFDFAQGMNSKFKTVRIRRVHMEEDTAKLMHQFGDQKSNLKSQNSELSLIDFNRSGVPLVEIVTEPDFESAGEVKIFLQKLQQIVRYLGVSNADMEKGDMRLEPNISIKVCHSEAQPKNPTGSFINTQDDNLPNYKVEVKNINSFKFVEKAIDYEVKRQIEILKTGETPIQETRGWNEGKQKTVTQRTKEEANDYRYFPEPDIPPIRFEETEIKKLKENMPELPDDKFERLIQEYGLTDYDAEIITRQKETADYFEEAARDGKPANITPKQVANTIINKKIDINKTLPAELIKTLKASSQFTKINDDKLKEIIKKVIKQNAKAVEDYKKGKIQVLGFLIGMVNKALTGEKIDPQIIKKIFEEQLA